jgi:aryl-alcohol dehydrogenase-like predicted oxidoreductase
MEVRRLGHSDLIVSVVGLGCDNFGMLPLERSRPVIDRALARGVTLFDTADVYGYGGASETQLGEVLGPRRNDIVLATKFGMAMDAAGLKRGASRRYIMEAVEASLRRLKTDWIDLYQLHLPDPNTPLEETLAALNDVVRQGKVRYIGCSNLPAAQVAEASSIAREKHSAPFVSAQDEYSLLVRRVELRLIPELQRQGMGLLPYYPLANGMLTGKYKRGAPIPMGTRMALARNLVPRYMTETNWNRLEKLQAFCDAQGRTLLELAMSWLASRHALPASSRKPRGRSRWNKISRR